MDSFNFYDIKVEKANAILKHRQLQKIANFFRLIEVCVILILISRLSMNLPRAVIKNSSGYFRDVSVILGSPRFVFVVGNAIVIILFVKSGHFSARESTPGADDPYEEFIKNSEKCQKVHGDDENMVKHYRRSQSEKLNHEKPPRRTLRRTETEKCMEPPEGIHSGEKIAKSWCPEDDLSNEEFRRTVEAFIARQQKLLREEE